ncbi:MAG: glutamate--cysteine ligase [Pseudomonadales bacterium]
MRAHPQIPETRRRALHASRLAPTQLLFRGVEKESLRIRPDGMLADTPHPEALGAPLTHPQITTDFSESQLELITGVHASPEDCIRELTDVHRFVYSALGDEMLWPASMPCMLPDADAIPIGRYGTSNKGMTKTVYRRGLANRYGATMQTISGIHYNFSVSEELLSTLGWMDQDARTDAYFGLIRNFRRYSWLLIYLFGASPAICRSFGSEQQTGLKPFDEGSLHLPWATSLRMGPLGYQSDAQRTLHVSYNSLADYAASIRQALSIHHPPYTRIGVRVDGEYRQLSDTLIQIENEFYGTIRPKRPIHAGERPLTALLERGVGYVEVRCLDLNPYLRVGIDEEQIRFLDTFLLFCLLADSPPDSPEESARMHRNQVLTVQRGREPGIQLETAAGTVALHDWANTLLDACASIAAWLDESTTSSGHAESLSRQRARVADPEQTPSAQLLAAMRQQQMPYFRTVMNQALAHNEWFHAHPLDAEELDAHRATARRSVEERAAIEAADSEPFDVYLQHYLRLP